MANLSKTHQSDPKKEVDGVWVDLLNGGSILVARAFNEKWKKKDRQLKKPYRSQIRRGQEIPDNVVERIMTQLLAKTTLKGWREIEITYDEELKAAGLTVPTGTKVGDDVELEFSIRNALVLFSDERYRAFRNDVVSAAMDEANFKAILDKDSEKNLPNVSPGK
ncbi:MAG: hypothetical protein GY757_18840 [bacterium]|nr:hypothetical protein [bacterium]